MNEIEKELFNLPEKTPFKITDVGMADWALSKINAAEKSYQSDIQYLDSVIEKAKKLKEERLKKIEQETEFLTQKLSEWTFEKIKNQKSKTVNLLNGSLSFRKQQSGIDIFNDVQVLEFCKKKDLKIKLECVFELETKACDKIIKAFEVGDNFKWKKKIINKEIVDYFKEKKVDQADFPGGKYTAGEDKFYIK